MDKESVKIAKNFADIERYFELLDERILVKDPSNLVDIKNVKGDGGALVDSTQRQLRSVDFAVAYFSDKSRVVFFQTILALENKTPVLCLVHEDMYKNFPENLLSYGEDFIQVRKYKNDNQIEEILSEYVEDLDPPKRRFNMVLKTKTLKQMEQLSRELDLTKAELLRRLVDKEYRRIFE